jgi:hypothetical protein
LYLYVSYVTVLHVGDPILVMMLHAVPAASALVAGAPRIAQLRADDLPAALSIAAVHSLVMFFIFQVFASPGNGFETYVVAEVLASAITLFIHKLQFNNIPILKRQLAGVACAAIGSLVYPWVHDTRPAEFPTTEQSSGVAQIMLVLSLCLSRRMRAYEDMGDTRTETNTPVTPVTFTKLDPWSRDFYTHSIGSVFMIIIAIVCRVPKPYEEAVLDGSAGGLLLASCTLAAAAAVVGVHTHLSGTRHALHISMARGATILATRNLLPQHKVNPRAAAMGVILCLAGDVLLRRDANTLGASDSRVALIVSV